MTDPDYQHLLDEARIEDRRCPGSGTIFALWAGIRARESDHASTDNPFDATGEADLHTAWARGHAIVRQNPIPLAPVVRLSSPALTHAARVHDAMTRKDA